MKMVKIGVAEALLVPGMGQEALEALDPTFPMMLLDSIFC